MKVGIVTASSAYARNLHSKKMSHKNQTNVSSPISFGYSQNESDNKKSIAAGAGILAALAIGIAACTHNSGAAKTSAKKIVSTGDKIREKIGQIKQNSMEEIERIIRENTAIDGIHLDVIDDAAGRRSADLTQPERFNQAATWIEVAYKKAYAKAKLSDGKNMLNYIHNRINKENDALAQMYAQLPKEEAEVRMTDFAKDIIKSDIHTGMTAEQFIKDMQETFMPKARVKLGI